MNTQSALVRYPLVLALILGLVVVPEALAGGKKGAHPSGGARRPPRMSAAHRSNKAPSHKAPSMARPGTPARPKANQGRPGNVATRSNFTKAHPSKAQPRGHNTVSKATTSAHLSPSTYRYGSGNNARRYQAYGYGRGYRNHYSAGRTGYGRSQGNQRAIVSRLRSVHTSLARLDRAYHGHRIQAMHHLSMAIRQLSHRSTLTGVNGRSNILAVGMNNRRPGTGGLNGNGRQPQRLTQAQSDLRMSLALRTTQGIALQFSHHGTYSQGRSRAGVHLQRAMQEMNTALVVR